MATGLWPTPLAAADRRQADQRHELQRIPPGRFSLDREHTGKDTPVLKVGVARSRPAAERQKNGFYVTPEEATVALVLHLGKWLDGPVHECACGDGAIARVLSRFGIEVIATDLVDRGYGQGGFDFLAHAPLAPNVITNPDFAVADKFIRHAAGSRLVAFLLKSDFWHAASRIALHDAFPPAQELILTWRLDWTGQGRPTMNTTWWVWGDVPKGRWLLPHPGVFA